jgi:hypothetical protein
MLGSCSLQLRRSSIGASKVYWQAERMFTREHYFASKSFAVREALNIAYLEGELLNKKTILMPYVNLHKLFQFGLHFK